MSILTCIRVLRRIDLPHTSRHLSWPLPNPPISHQVNVVDRRLWEPLNQRDNLNAIKHRYTPILGSITSSCPFSSSVKNQNKISGAGIPDGERSMECHTFLFKVAEVYWLIERHIVHQVHNEVNRIAQERQQASKTKKHQNGAKERSCPGPMNCQKMNGLRDEIDRRASDPQIAMAQQEVLMRILQQYNLTLDDWTNLKALVGLRNEIAHPKVHPAEIPQVLDMSKLLNAQHCNVHQ
ncbi:hypothetical protein BGX31_007559 [Mortierella sp. GBA43]|nr:hypothetical protein BGX31_007559 [Mortierella sp. GBA43]